MLFVKGSSVGGNCFECLKQTNSYLSLPFSFSRYLSWQIFLPPFNFQLCVIVFRVMSVL